MKKNIYIIILLYLFVPLFLLFAQEEQIVRKLDILIRKQRSIVRRLERMDIWEISDDIQALKKNIRLMREIKLLINKLKKSSSGSKVRNIRKLKEEVRELYLRLSEIPLITKTIRWKKAEKLWFKLQTKNPEFMPKYNLGFYQDQLNNLLQEFKKMELDAQKEYRKMLDETHALYLTLKDDPWANTTVRWKRFSKSWEKTWNNRREEGIDAASSFEDLRIEILQIQRIAKRQKMRVKKRIEKIYNDVKKFYEELSPIGFVRKQKVWAELDKRWLSVKDIEIEKISPSQAKKLEIELITLKNNFWSFKLELKEKLTRLYQEAQKLYDEIKNDKWAKVFNIYNKVIKAWEKKWLGKLEIEIFNADEIENILNNLRWLKKQSQYYKDKIFKQIALLKKNINHVINELENISLVKKEDKWFSIQNEWSELQYTLIIYMEPKKVEKYRMKLENIYKSLLELKNIVRKKLNKLFKETKKLYVLLSYNEWARNIPLWEEIEKIWNSKFMWKTYPSFEDTSVLENLYQKLKIVKAHAFQNQKYLIKEAQKKLKSLKKKLDNLYFMKDKEPKWNIILQQWDKLRTTNLDILSPVEMEKYFKELKKFEVLLDKAEENILTYCVKILAKAEEEYNNLIKNPWTKYIEEWNKVSYEWLAKKPISEEITLKNGEFVENYLKKFKMIQKKIKEMRKMWLAKINIVRKKLKNIYEEEKRIPLITQKGKWLDISYSYNKFMKQDYYKFDKKDIEDYYISLVKLTNKMENLKKEAYLDLNKLWKNIQKTYISYSNNPWISFLIRKNKIDLEWEKDWKNKKEIKLNDSKNILKFKNKLERCRPFWWRPLTPNKPIPKNKYLLDYTSLKLEGVPSVPQWSKDGDVLSFQSLFQEQYSIKLLDIVTGQIKTVQLYDPKRRWVSYESWAPIPFEDRLVFTGRKLGFYDIYYIKYSRTQFPEPKPLTDSSEYEKSPKFVTIDNKLFVFFIQENSILYTDKLGNAKRLFFNKNIKDLEHLAVYWDRTFGMLKVVFTAKESYNYVVYYIKALKDGNYNFVIKEFHKISELEGKHFAPTWTLDGRWIVSYIERKSKDIQIVRIFPEMGKETVITEDTKIYIPQGSEMKFKSPEVFGNIPHVIFCNKPSNKEKNIVTIMPIENPVIKWDIEEDDLFKDTSHLALSPDTTYLAWISFKEGKPTLMIGVINLNND